MCVTYTPSLQAVMGKHEKKQAGRQAAVKSSPKQKREIMTEKDNQEVKFISLGDKAASGSGSQEQPGAPEGESWETAATPKSKIMISAIGEISH